MTYDLFISYKHQDEDDGILRTSAVRDLAAQLEGAGLSVFRDETCIEPFEGITPKVQEGIENARALLVYFSDDYTLSRACMAELRAMYIAASQNGWKPPERIFILNPEPHSDHFNELPVDLRDINAARNAASAVAELPAHIEDLAGTFGRHGLRDRPIQYGRSLTGSKRFVGRTREMWEIHSLLNASECAQITGHAGHPDMAQVSGMGGIGKSLLAEEYALRFGAAYPGGVFWLSAHGSYNPNAPDIESFAAACKDQFLALTESLGRQLPPDTSLGILQHTIRQIIESKGERCLWVVDDIPCGLATQVDAVKAWFSPHPLARTLITTRSHEYRDLAGELALELLDDVQARRLLKNHNIDIAGQEEDTQELLELLAGHALALDVAGAAIEENGGYIRPFLEHIEEDNDDLLDASVDLTGALPAGHAPSIVRTFKHSIDRLDEPGKDLLCIAACLSPEPIRDEFIEQVFRQTDDLEEQDGKKLAKRALRQAAQYSLINRQPGRFTVHALISATVGHLDMTADERGQALLRAAVELLHDIVNPQATHQEAAAIALEIAHARFLTASINEDSDPGLLLLLNRLGFFDYYRGNVHLAVKDFRQMVTIREKTLGPDHPDTLTSMDDLGETLRIVGDHAGARKLQEQVLKKMTSLLGPDHPSTLTSLNNLAETLRAMGEHAGARKLEEQVLEKMTSLLGPDHPSTTTSAWNLFLTLHRTKAHKEAQALLETELLWLLKKDLVLHDGQQRQIREMLKDLLSEPDNPYKQPSS